MAYPPVVPDWFYRTVSRPLLFRLPAEQAQSVAGNFMGVVGDLPGGLGGAFIDFLGHMRPDAGWNNLPLDVNSSAR